MSRVANTPDSEALKAARPDNATAMLSAQITVRFDKAIGVYIATNDLKKTDVVRSGVADKIGYVFEPWELERNNADAGEKRKRSFAATKSQAALAEKLMDMMRTMGFGDQLEAMLAESQKA